MLRNLKKMKSEHIYYKFSRLILFSLYAILQKFLIFLNYNKRLFKKIIIY